MKKILRSNAMGLLMLLVIFLGCTPSQEQVAAREAKVRDACERQLAAAAAATSIEALNKAIETTHAKVGATSAAPMIQQTLERLLGEGHFGLVEQATDFIITTKTLEELHVLAFAMQFKGYSASKAWPKLRTSIIRCATLLSDEAAEPLVRQIYSALQRDKQLDLLEKTSQQLYRETLNKPGLLRLGTETWVGLCIAKDKQLLPASLEALLADQVSPDQVATLLDRYFYELTESKEIMKKIGVLGPKIVALTQNKATQASVTMRMLDSAFLLEDYDRAIEMLEKGIPGRDKAWHDTTLPKVKAHRAMAQNKPVEAIEGLRQFMVAWKNAKTVDEMDPTTGLVYNREWILGRNAIRIAKLYASIPDEGNRKMAMKEATEYFSVARSKLNPGSKEMTALTQEMKEAGL